VADFLGRLASAAAERASEARPREADLVRRAAEAPAPRRLALDGRGFDLLAEFKRRSPATGPFEPLAGLVLPGERARAYARGGAAAISVLTEPREFGGSLDDVSAASAQASLPVLRKDFLVDPLQVVEARAAGASGVLVILRIVDDARLGELLDAAALHGLFVLLEAFDARDLERAARAAADVVRRGAQALVGVNARDLTTLRIDPARFAALAPRLPAGVPAVAESGLTRPDDARALAGAGYRAVLVGGALMRASDPEAFIAETLRAGRDEVAAGA
jgi:indole-3-glycerol phosphate synthase